MISILGFIAAFVNAISLIPEVKKALQTHHLRDVAWGMLIFLCSSSLMWVFYGIHHLDYPIIVSDGINLIMALFLINLKIHYEKGNKPLLAKNWIGSKKVQKKYSALKQ